MRKIIFLLLFSYCCLQNGLHAQCSPTIITSGNTTLCTNFTNSVVLTATASPFGASYSWTPGGATGPFVTVTPTVTTIYTVTITYTNGCTASQTLAVTVQSNCCTQTPTVITNGTQTLCINYTNTAVLSATASPSGGTFGWSPGGGTGPTTVVTPTANTIYTVTVTYSNGCQATRTVAVIISTNCCTQTPTIITSGNTTLCTNFTNSVVLTATVLPTTGIINWSPGGGTGTVVAVTPTTTTIYTLTVTYTNGCVATRTLAVTVQTNCCTQTPTIITNGTQTLCINYTNTAVLSATASPIGGSFGWSPGGGTGPTTVVTPTANTIYTVTVTYSNGCQATRTIAVVISTNCCTQTPTIITSGNATLCTNVTNSLVLTATVLPTTGSINWSPGGGTGTMVTVTPTTTTIYTLTVTFTNGCVGTSTLAVTVQTNCCTQTLITSGNTTLCANSTNSAIISATASVPSGANYSWSPNGGTGSVVAVSPTTTTIYTVTVSYTTGCVITATLSVTVFTNCCPNSTISPIGTYTLNSTTVSGPVIVTSNILVTGGGVSTLQNGAFLMGPDVKIIVSAGSQLDLNGAHLYACGLRMWDGIEVQDGGKVTGAASANNVTLIEDAKTAISLDNINSPTSIPVDLTGVIFNRNYIGISFTNGSVSSLNVRLKSCVFTSRDLPFSLTSWPGSSTSSPNLRYASSGALNGVSAPYLFQGYSLVNLKIPYSSQSAQTGIRISNIDNTAGSTPAPGVNINSWYAMADTTFNLFDFLNTGIDVKDASLTTMNNVFQNILYFSGSGGSGIRHNIGSLMNARLSLSPQIVSPSISNSNRFWDCYYGVEAYNVYEFDMSYGLVRSSQTTSGGGFVPGYKGIYLSTNRFSYMIENNQFNNVNNAVDISIADGNYDMGSGTVSGVFPSGIQILSNYFGPQVSSSTPAGSNYLNRAVALYAPNGSSFASSTSGVTIYSNKIDRAYRGVSIIEMAAYPVDVSGNLINLENDGMFVQRQYGIQVVNTLDQIMVIENQLSGNGTGNTLVSLVYCESNSGNGSPLITCNSTSNSYNGFEFYRANPATIWNGNSMRTHRRGLLLRNNAVIGAQGSGGSPSGNLWLGSWVGPNFGTYTDNSNAASSVLFVGSGAPPLYPPNNSGTSFPQTYNAGGNLVITGGTYNCVSLGLPQPPSNRMANSTSLLPSDGEKTVSGNELLIYPNPASDKVLIETGMEITSLVVVIYDLSGKKVVETSVSTQDHKATLSLSLDQGLYLFEIREEGQPAVFKKMMITK